MTRVKRDLGRFNHLLASGGGGTTRPTPDERAGGGDIPSLAPLELAKEPSRIFFGFAQDFHLAAQFLACSERKPKRRENGSTCRLQMKNNRKRTKTAFQNAGLFVVHLAL